MTWAPTILKLNEKININEYIDNKYREYDLNLICKFQTWCFITKMLFHMNN